MKQTIILVIAFNIFFIPCLAQKKKVAANSVKTSTVGKSAKINSEQASIFIKVEGDGKYTSDRAKETYDITWFRLYNNFKGDISFCVYDLSVSPTGKIGLHYEIEKNPNYANSSSENNEEISNGFPRYDFCNRYKLKGGKSFLFGIPKSQLVKETRIKIQFFYAWEDEFISNEPVNYVYYYAPYHRVEK